MKQAYLVVDVGLCFDCNNCFMSCKDEYVGNTWLPYSEEQPRHDHKWLDIKMKERGTYPRIDVAYVPVMCQHCENCPVEKAAPECFKRLDNGIVLLDPAKAKDKKELVKACPYGAIDWNAEKCIPQKCTMCAHILETKEEPKMPRCAHSCPTNAISYFELEPEEMAKKIEAEGLEEFCPELDSKPHVFYKNLYRYKKAFIWGELLKDNDCAEGVEVTLKGKDVEATAVTDEFGEFKFDDLAPGTYEVFVGDELIKKVKVKDAVNIGEIVLA